MVTRPFADGLAFGVADEFARQPQSGQAGR